MYQVEKNHFWYEGMRKITDNLLQPFLADKKSLKILDAGCGTGANMSHLKRLGEVYGVDISKEAIRFSRKRGLKNLKIASISKLPYKTNFFDLVVCFDVIGQAEVESVKEAIKEFKRVLKPGGILLIRVAAFNWLYSKHDKVVHTKHRYTSRELENLVKQVGLKKIRVSYANILLFPPLLVKRFIERRRSEKGYENSDVTQINSVFNSVLKLPLFIEAIIIKYINLPFGFSVNIVAKK